MELMHKTPVDDVPGAIASFQGRVLIGVGKNLRVYDLGKKKLLRKCENKVSKLSTSQRALVQLFQKKRRPLSNFEAHT